jgi:hypothetical protein
VRHSLAVAFAVIAVAVLTAQAPMDSRLEGNLKQLFPGATAFSPKAGDPPHFKAMNGQTLLGLAFWTTELQPLERSISTIERHPAVRRERAVDARRIAMEDPFGRQRRFGDLRRIALDAKRGIDRAHDRYAQCCGTSEPSPGGQRQARFHAQRGPRAVARHVQIEQRTEGLAQELGLRIGLFLIRVKGNAPGFYLEPRSFSWRCESFSSAGKCGGDRGPAVHDSVLAEQNQLSVTEAHVAKSRATAPAAQACP